jgi:hypothetical protein
MCVFIVFGLPALTTGVFAQEQDTLPPPGELKRLTIEQLMTIEVTSVSRRPESLSHAPSDRLHLTIGTRVEHTEYTGLELQPNVRMAWTPNACPDAA